MIIFFWKYQYLPNFLMGLTVCVWRPVCSCEFMKLGLVDSGVVWVV